MRLRGLIVGFLALLLIESRAHADPTPPQKPKDAVFHVRCVAPQTDPRQTLVGYGSAFATKRNGHLVIVTATHVVKINPEKEAIISGVNYPTWIRVKFSVWEGDICYAEVDALPEGWGWTPMAAEPPKAGDTIGAWGFPHNSVQLAGYASTVSGLKVDPSSYAIDGGSKFQYNFGLVIVGMSGGPVVNSKGEVYGIVSARAARLDPTTHQMIELDEWFSALLPN